MEIKHDYTYLDGDWSLVYVGNKKLKSEAKDISTVSALEKTGYRKISAKVPGNLEIDLFRAGIIKDPYKYSDAMQLYDYEGTHLFYYRSFLVADTDGEQVLHFDGIDTVSEIFLNGEIIGTSENMLISHEFDVSGKLKKDENELIVHIIPTMIAARDTRLDPGSRHKGPRTPTLAIRKAPHMFGWDIMPRLISGGIWKSVYIEKKLPDRIDDVFIMGTKFDYEKCTASVSLYVHTTLSEDDTTGYAIRVYGVCGDSSFDELLPKMWNTGTFFPFTVTNAKFWMPRNYGEPNVYDVRVELMYHGKTVDLKKTTLGLRSVELIRTDITDEAGSGEFVFRINGRKIFAMGTNWVPADAMQSFDETRIPELLPMLSDIGCNIIRCWGGNVYESDHLYDYCDRNGIMVWQDFSMACALYPQDETFKKVIFNEAESVIRRLRNHPSIILWAGDNECDEGYFWGECFMNLAPDSNAITREVLPYALRINDPSRPYLPSSPYLTNEVKEKNIRRYASEAHLWGPRDYFKGDYYGKSICHFASETGYHGCPSPDSLKRFISEDQLWHWSRDKRELKKGELWGNHTDAPKPDWTIHASCVTNEPTEWDRYRIPLMANQVITLFGREPSDLDTFAYQSQISQAEAKKYFIERFRVTKWRRTGIIWWNLVDGWPQVSDAVVDYYGTKKLAYHYIKRSQAPLCFIFDEPGENKLPLFVASDLQEDKTVKYNVTDLTTDEVISYGEVTAKANEVTHVFDKEMIDGEKRFYLIEWEYDGLRGKNHYFTNIIDIDYDIYVSCMKKAGFYDEFEGFGDAHPKKSAELPYAFDLQRDFASLSLAER